MKQNIKDFNISCLKGILEMSKPIRLYFFETELSEIWLVRIWRCRNKQNLTESEIAFFFLGYFNFLNNKLIWFPNLPVLYATTTCSQISSLYLPHYDEKNILHM